MEVLNPLAREFKSIGTIRKELAELQEELAQAHNQVYSNACFYAEMKLIDDAKKWKSKIFI